jgi:CBS domain-containing protein
VYRYVGGKVDWLAAGLSGDGELADELRIGAIAHTDVPTCRLDQRIGELGVTGDLCVVVNEARVVLGDLRGKALHADPSQPVEQVMDPAPSTYRPNTSVHEMAHAMLESGSRRVLVSDCDGRLIGWISREDVETALDEQRRHASGPVLASSE